MPKLLKHSFEKRAELSDVVGTLKIIASSVGPNGEACLLLVAPRFEAEPFARDEGKGSASFARSRARTHYPATFLRFNGKVLQRTQLSEVDIAFPTVQPLPKGEILLVGARCRYRKGDPERNAVVFDNEGNIVRRLVLGDGINDVQATSDGKIWVSYFDEGVIGNRGWDIPIGRPGLICFDAKGGVIWSFEPPSGVDTIVDCYALNVGPNSVWTSYYSGFPFIEIDSRRRARAWKNTVRGASALAVVGSRVAFWGGYGAKRTRCVVQKMGRNALVNQKELEIGFPDGIDAMSVVVAGRAGRLHAFVKNSWFIFDLKNAL